jgi:hypothetical protein
VTCLISTYSFNKKFGNRKILNVNVFYDTFVLLFALPFGSGAKALGPLLDAFSPDRRVGDLERTTHFDYIWMAEIYTMNNIYVTSSGRYQFCCLTSCFRFTFV